MKLPKILVLLLGALKLFGCYQPARAQDTTLNTFQTLTGASVDLATDKFYLWDTSASRAKGILGSELLIGLRLTTSSGIATNVSDETGSGSLVMATSPTLITPTIGVATATSVNKVAITAPATSATLTLANGKTFTVSNTLTLTGTDGSTVTLGAGGTVIYATNHLGALAATTSDQLAGVLTDELGTGSFVRNTSPTFVTPSLGAATATSLTASGAIVGGDSSLKLIATPASAPGITVGSTIAPTTRICFVSGPGTINTITVPSSFSSGGGQVTIIPTGAFTTTTADNIAVASTAVVGKALTMTYDSGTGLWYPSY